MKEIIATVTLIRKLWPFYQLEIISINIEGEKS